MPVKKGSLEKFKDIKKGKVKVYNKKVTLVLIRPNGRREVVDAFVCPEDWRFCYGSAK